ncbi:MAG: helix-turn-helix transcriptional regulator [Candidatus Micrarchaeota archaeon]
MAKGNKKKKQIRPPSNRPVARLINSITISNLWLSILSLAKRGKIYAYTLPEKINEKFGFKPSRLLVYLVLYKLESEKLLSSKEDGQRKYYSLTKEGRNALQDAKAILENRAGEL